jgi:regulator of protease activity HflC (stomatin/prohibitin superfamily)
LISGSSAAAKFFALARGWNGAMNKRLQVGITAAALGMAGLLLYKNFPVQAVGRGEVGLRENRFSGEVTEWRDGSVLVVPGVHQLRIYALRDQAYRPAESARADGPAPLQSLEGLSIGVDLQVRYALDPAKLRAVSARLPEDIAGAIVRPAVNGAMYSIFARYTVREIFSTKRAEIQQAMEAALAERLGPDGIALRGVLIGKIDLPADYRKGMEGLLAEELASAKMRYTLELKEKRVKEVALEGDAEKVRREKSAEAMGQAQVIAARSQEEAMKHVLPLKERQIQQRKLEADADKEARIRQAEAAAQARRIEARGEAEARQKLADAEAYRLDKVGRTNAEQLAREGDVLSRHPLLIQKAFAEKLSEKLQVIIAPPPAEGGFIGSNLVGGLKR